MGNRRQVGGLVEVARYQTRRAWAHIAGMGARLPLRWRLTLMTFGMLAVLLTALGAVVSVIEEQTLLANQAVALHGEARLAAGVLRGTGLEISPANDSHPVSTASPPPGAVQALAYVVQRLTGTATWSAVYATDGTLLYSSAYLPDRNRAFVPPSVELSHDTTLRAERSTLTEDGYITAMDASGQRQLVVLLPLEDVAAQQTVALLEVSTSTAPIDAAVTSTRLVLALGIGGALLVAGAVMLPLMSAGLRPLVAMERASQRIAAGALSLRLDEPPTKDEIGTLARSFNAMVAQLEAAFARQKQFVADVSHELRTPLTALGGGLEMQMLGADRGDAEASRRLTRGMYREVERMRRLVEDLLTLTRLDEGRARPRIGAVAMNTLVVEVAEEAERLAPQRRVRVEMDGQLPLARGDADYIRQVLLSLLDNAFKYTPEPGEVSLTARREDAAYMMLQVRDTGIGIPPEALPHVFERFYRVDPARARTLQHAGGAGLGLSIAKSLVEVQGGQIEIESAVNAGTTVTLRFPTFDGQRLRAGDGAPLWPATLAAPPSGTAPSHAEPKDSAAEPTQIGRARTTQP